jgi:hypothetical protein
LRGPDSACSDAFDIKTSQRCGEAGVYGAGARQFLVEHVGETEHIAEFAQELENAFSKRRVVSKLH